MLAGSFRRPITVKRLTASRRSLHRAYLLSLLLLLAPFSAFSQSAAEWSQIKAKCGISSSTAYNDWVAQGCPCKSSTPSTTAAPALPGIDPAQQLGTQIGTLGANMIGQGLHQLWAGKPTTPTDPAQQQAQLAANQLNNSGIWFFKQKQYRQAINEFEQALQRTPNDQTIKNNLALSKRLLEQSRKDGMAASQTSGALGNLLGTGSGAPSTAGFTPGSTQNSMDLNFSTGTVDLRGTTKTAVDPDKFMNGAPQARNAAPLTQQDLDAQFDQAMNESERDTQADRKQLNDAFDEVMNDSDAQALTETRDLNSQFDKAYNDSALHSANAEQAKKVRSDVAKPVGSGDTSKEAAVPQKLADLQTQLNALKSRCSSVEQGSVAAASCKADQTKLRSEMASLQ